MKTYDNGFDEKGKDKIRRKKGANSNMKKIQRYVASLNQEQIARMMEDSGKPYAPKGADVTANAIYRKALQERPLSIQAKLEISQPGDASEVQADKVADAVSRGDVNMSRMTMEQTGSEINMKGEGGTLTTTPEFNQQLEGTKGQGQSLDESMKGELEQHTGTDLSGVKVHTGSMANEMSEGINAKAFTHGQDIYFKEGNYSPRTPEGKSLLAHEVAHTVQQGEGVQKKVQRMPDETLRSLLNEADEGKRKDGFEQLKKKNNKIAWETLLLEQDNRYPDTAKAIKQYLGSKLRKDSKFKSYIDTLIATPEDLLSDLAIRLIIENQLGGAYTATGLINLDTYRSIIKERLVYLKKVLQEETGPQNVRAFRIAPGNDHDKFLDVYEEVLMDSLASDWSRKKEAEHLREMKQTDPRGFRSLIESKAYANVLNDPNHPAVKWYDDYIAKLPGMKLKELNELGVIVSNQMQSFAKIQGVLGSFDLYAATVADNEQLAKDVDWEKYFIVNQLFSLHEAPDGKNPYENTLLDATGRVRISMVDSLEKKVIQIKDDVNYFLAHGFFYQSFHNKTYDSDQDADGNTMKARVADVFAEELDYLLNNNLFEYARSSARIDSGMSLSLRKIQEENFQESMGMILPALQTLTARYALLSFAEEALRGFNTIQIELVHSYDETNQYTYSYLVDFMAARFFAGVNALLAISTEDSIDAAFNKVNKHFEGEKSTGQLAKFNEGLKKLNIELADEMKGMQTLFDILLIVIAMMTVNPTVMLARGLLQGTVMRLESALARRLLMGSASLLSGSMAFHLAHKALKRVFYGESMSANFWSEYGETVATFFFLGRVGQLYRSVVGPWLGEIAKVKFPKNLPMQQGIKVAGGYSFMFLGFQAWSMGVYTVKKQELPGVEETLEQAENNLLMLGALHIGMKLTEPIRNMIDSPAYEFLYTRHMQACEKLKVDFAKYLKTENKTVDKTVSFLERMKGAVNEQIAVFTDAKSLGRLTPEEYMIIVEKLLMFKDMLQDLISLKDIDLYADRSGDNLLYYRGTVENAEKDFKAAGYKYNRLPGETSFDVTINGETYRAIQSSTRTTDQVSTRLIGSISEIVVRAGYDWYVTRTKFGSDGSPEDNMVLMDAWMNDNWRPDQPVPDKYKSRLNHAKRTPEVRPQTTLAGEVPVVSRETVAYEKAGNIETLNITTADGAMVVLTRTSGKAWKHNGKKPSMEINGRYLTNRLDGVLALTNTANGPVLLNPADFVFTQNVAYVPFESITTGKERETEKKQWKEQQAGHLLGFTAYEYITELFNRNSVADNPVNRAAIADVLDSGTASRLELFRVFDNAIDAGIDPQSVVDMLGELAERKREDVTGIGSVIGAMEAGGNNFKGVWWMLEYIDHHPDLWDQIDGFEITENTLAGGEKRRYDMVLRDGTRFQFKSWETWDKAGFSKQFQQDVDIVGIDGIKDGKLKWVFEETSLGQYDAIKLKMENAINSLPARFDAIRQDLLDNIDNILVVGY